MSLDKAIEHGKEKRKAYTGAKAIDPSCRNHGNHGHGPGNECPWCKGNRLHNNKSKDIATKQQLKEALTTEE